MPKRLQTDDQLRILMELAERIRLVRQHYELTQEDFASNLGVSRSHLSEVERHRRKPSIEMAVGIARAYPGVSADWLLSGVPPMFSDAEVKAHSVSTVSRVTAEMVIEIITDIHDWHLNNKGKGLSAELWGSLVQVLPGVLTKTFSLGLEQPGATPKDALETAMQSARRVAEAIVAAAEPS